MIYILMEYAYGPVHTIVTSLLLGLVAMVINAVTIICRRG